MELTVRANFDGLILSRRAAEISTRMSEFRSRVLLSRQDVTVNAKSLMGLMSLELRAGQPVTIIAEGEDDAQAVCAMAALIGA